MRWFIPVLQLFVASASVSNIIRFRMDNLLLEAATALDYATLAALAAIIVLTAGVLVLCWRMTVLSLPHVGVAALLVGVTALSGFVPQVVETHRRAAEQAARQAEKQHWDEAFVRELLGWVDDVDKRAASAHRFASEQAWVFLDCISHAGYWNEGPAPFSVQALMLLRKALAAGLIDVNANVPGHSLKDMTPRPLFLQFYKERIEPLRYALSKQDWEIMRLLATNGADLSLPDAAPLVADLAKNPVPGPGRFIELK